MADDEGIDATQLDDPGSDQVTAAVGLAHHEEVHADDGTYHHYQADEGSVAA